MPPLSMLLTLEEFPIILVSTKRAAARRCTADVFLSVGVPRVTHTHSKTEANTGPCCDGL